MEKAKGKMETMKSQNIDQLKEETNERLKGSGYALKCDGMVWTISRQPVVLNLSEATAGAFAANRDAVEAVLGAIEVERTALDAFEKAGDTLPPSPGSDWENEAIIARNLAAEKADALGKAHELLEAFNKERDEWLSTIDQQRIALSELRVELADSQKQAAALREQLMTSDLKTETKEEKPNA